MGWKDFWILPTLNFFWTPPPTKKLGGGVEKTWRWCQILKFLRYWLIFQFFSSPNVTIPDHFWWVLTLFWQILTIFEIFWCLLTFFWHFMATFAASWHFSDDFWHFLTLFDTLFDDSWHFLTLFDNSWQFSNLGITSCELLGIIGLRIIRYHFLRFIRYHSNANY